MSKAIKTQLRNSSAPKTDTEARPSTPNAQQAPADSKAF